ncbi:Enoyl-CoA hydratase/carnithine racemase [Cryobacterium flavum]|uniref:enoyl-CoA hydratase n=1 Tax=Cryobacterium flavum TaxID=1424659 RepID=A0A4R8UYS9_9MICO|nr:enoyl-CoA hydratase-related protein [Cryobacterium flavum]TFB73616.1 enoyl-CoA hydratase/isomerase family protein [Cryobacterium flavum]SDO32589.1 Enoyl-CoA hydratase/carnithine racemase [Cryobacterium flavum]
MSDDQLVHLEVVDQVGVVTLDNPPMNVTTLGLARALADAVRRVAADDTIRAVVLTGAGDRAFNAGSDIKEMPEMLVAGDIIRRKIAFENETFTYLENLGKPTIAALNGVAFGGGLEMALCCDFIVADETTSMGLPEVKLGLFPGAGGPVRTARRIGEARAKQLIFLGEPLDAAIAFEWGLVDRIAPRGTALVAAMELGRQLAGIPAVSLRLAKGAISLRRDMSDSQALLASVPLFDEVCTTADASEGVSAFISRRTPAFFHR